MKIFLYLLLFLPLTLFSQTEKEVDLMNTFNQMRQYYHRDTLEFNNIYYPYISNYIKTIKPPKDTTILEIDRVISEVNMYVDNMYSVDIVNIDYGSAILETIGKSTHIKLLGIIETSADAALARQTLHQTFIIKEWEYDVLGKKFMFVYIMAFR